MALVMGVYRPQVRCRGIFPPEASCSDIIYGMPASTTMQTFGPQSDPAATVNIPHTLGSGKPLNVPVRVEPRTRSDLRIHRRKQMRGANLLRVPWIGYRLLVQCLGGCHGDFFHVSEERSGGGCARTRYAAKLL